MIHIRGAIEKISHDSKITIELNPVRGRKKQKTARVLWSNSIICPNEHALHGSLKSSKISLFFQELITQIPGFLCAKQKDWTSTCGYAQVLRMIGHSGYRQKP